MSKKSPLLSPGTPAPFSGQYAVFGPKGGKTGQEVTAVQGKALPPTSGPGMKFGLIDPTHNGAGGFSRGQ